MTRIESARSPRREAQSSSSGPRPRQMFGKFRIAKLLANSGFAKVYSAFDTIEGIWVALKLPHGHFVDDDMIDLFRHEVRLVAKLDHPNILPVKEANFIDGQFVVATRLGHETLADRLTRRMSVPTALGMAEQMIAAVAYAHEVGIIHCDVKPENFILFADNQLRLADFGIAKVSTITVAGSGTGTIGHMAPEQAMGRPSMRSDVF